MAQVSGKQVGGAAALGLAALFAVATPNTAHASTVGFDFIVNSQNNTGIATGRTISCVAGDAIVTQMFTSATSGFLSASGSFACEADGSEVGSFEDITFNLVDGASGSFDFSLFEANGVIFLGSPGTLTGSLLGRDLFENAGLNVADITDLNALNVLIASGNSTYNFNGPGTLASGSVTSTNQVDAAVPLPAAGLLLPAGIVILGFVGRRRKENEAAVLTDVNVAYEGAKDGAVAASSFNNAVVAIVQSGKVNLGAYATNVLYADLDAISRLKFETKVEHKQEFSAPSGPLAAVA